MCDVNVKNSVVICMFKCKLPSIMTITNNYENENENKCNGYSSKI